MKRMRMTAVEAAFIKSKNAILFDSLFDRQKATRLARLKRDFCRRLAKKPLLALEVKRRIAEAVLYMSIMRGRSHATCRARFKSLTKVGFTDIEQKAHYSLIYARAALQQGHRRVALRRATKLSQELQRSLRTRPSRLGRELLQHFHELERQASPAKSR